MLEFDKSENKVVQDPTATPPQPLEKLPPDKLHNRYFFVGVIIVFGLLLFFSLIQFFTAFLGAVIIYILSRRTMNKLVKRYHWGKNAAAVTIMLLSAIIIILPIGLFVYMVYMKGRYYIANPRLLVASLHKIQTQIEANYGIQILSDETIVKVQDFATSLISKLLNESLDFFSTITMLYFFLYFMLMAINRLEAAVVFFLPFKRNKIELFGRELVAQTYSNAVGVPVIAIAQGLIGYLAYTFIGLPEAGFWAVITGFSSIVPIVGTGLVWVPVALYMFVMHHTWQGVFMLVWGMVVLGSADNVVRFVLAKRMADVHPVVTVLGVILGLKLFGITGLIFGPVLISFYIILLRIYYMEYQSKAFPVVRKKTIPIRLNLPFLRFKTKKKRRFYASKGSFG